MDINEILDTTTRRADDIIADLKRKAIALPSWADLRKEYEARLHPVFTDKSYKDKPRKDGSLEMMTRIALPLQKLATKRMGELLFAIPVKRVYRPETEEQQRAAKIMEGVFMRNRIDAVNIARARALYASCEFCTVWYAQEQEAIYGGEVSPIKLRCKTYNPMDGAQIFPLFDEYDDLKALSVEYLRDDGTRDVRYIDCYTADRHIRWSDNGKSGTMSVEVDEPVTIGKIQAVYAYRPEPIWEGQSQNVYEAEWTLSRNGNFIRKNARPNFVVYSDSRVQFGKDNEGDSEGRSVFQYPSNAKAEYVTWQQATESLKYHVDEIKRNFFMSLQLPDMSMDKMSATPMSGEARKMLFIDAQMKAGDESGLWYEVLDREVNVVRSFIASIFPDLSQAVKTLAVEVEICPYTIRDEAERIGNLTQAVGGQAIMSQRTAIANLGYVDDVDEEMAQISSESAAGMADLFNQPTE